MRLCTGATVTFLSPGVFKLVAFRRPTMNNSTPWHTPISPPGALRPAQLILATTAALWMGSVSLPSSPASPRQNTQTSSTTDTPRGVGSWGARKV